MLNLAPQDAPVWLSLLAGAALWEIVGRNSNPAFLVPLSETLTRLWQLTSTREFAVQFLNSADAVRHRRRPRASWSACRSACCSPACASCASGSTPTS